MHFSLRKLNMKKFILLFAFIFYSNFFAQTFGFGCLGLSGIYVGISEYKYEVPAINDYLTHQKLSNDKLEFTRGTGYRIGANLFRAKWEGFFITAKGFYQFIKEEKISKNSNPNFLMQKNFQLNLNNWSLGLDFGTPIFKFLDFKILEGNLSYYSPELNIEYYENTNFVNSNKFQPEKIKLAYFVGSGLILHLVPDYISFEGTVGYNFNDINQFIDENKIIIGSETIKAIKNGGWSYTLQINVGFPL